MHDMIELAHNVIAGEHHDHPRCATSTAVGARHRVHLAASTDGDKAVQLATVTTGLSLAPLSSGWH